MVADVIDPLVFQVAPSNQDASLRLFIDQSWGINREPDPPFDDLEALFGRHHQLTGLLLDIKGWMAYAASEMTPREEALDLIKHCTRVGGDLGRYHYDPADGGAADIRTANAAKAYYMDALRLSTAQQFWDRRSCHDRLDGLRLATQNSLVRIELILRLFRGGLTHGVG